MLGAGQPALGTVAIQLSQLRAVQRQRGIAPALRRHLAEQHPGQRRQGHHGKPQQNHPDHHESNSASRACSAGESGGGGARRRIAPQANTPPSARASTGDSHSTAVIGVKGGERRTKLP